MPLPLQTPPCFYRGCPLSLWPFLGGCLLAASLYKASPQTVDATLVYRKLLPVPPRHLVGGFYIHSCPTPNFTGAFIPRCSQLTDALHRLSPLPLHLPPPQEAFKKFPSRSFLGTYGHRIPTVGIPIEGCSGTSLQLPRQTTPSSPKTLKPGGGGASLRVFPIGTTLGDPPGLPQHLRPARGRCQPPSGPPLPSSAAAAAAASPRRASAAPP